MRLTQLGRMRFRGAVMAGLTVAMGALGTAGSAAAQGERHATPRAPRCPDCDTTADARIARELDAAGAELQQAHTAVLIALQQLAAQSDTTGVNTEALVRAQGQWRRAQERYERMTAQLLKLRVEEARRSADMSLSDLPGLGRGDFAPDGWLGVTFSAGISTIEQNGDHALMRFDDYPTIESVDPASPAERAGLQAGDRLVALDGKDVTTGCEPFSTLLKPGAHLALRIKRGRFTKDLTAVIQKRPRSESVWSWSVTPGAGAVPAVAAPAPPDAPAPPQAAVRVFVDPTPAFPPIVALAPRAGAMEADMSVVAGAELREVGSLRDYFGVSDGVLVLHVVPGSVADRSGLRDGDVILKADGKRVATPGALSRAIYRAGDAQQLTLDIIRLRKPRSVVLKWASR